MHHRAWHVHLALLAVSSLTDFAVASPCPIPLAGSHSPSSFLNLGVFLDRPREVAHDVLTPPSLTSSAYAFGRCGPGGGIGHDGQLPDFEQCSPSDLICLTATNSRPNHRAEAPRITSVVPVASSLADGSAKLVPRSDSEYADIEVTLFGEEYVNVRQQVKIKLVCDQSAPEPSDPTFVEADKTGVHHFQWFTRNACLEIARVGPAAPPAAPPADDEGPKDNAPPEVPPLKEDPSLSRATRAGPLLYASAALNILLFSLILLSLRALRCLRTSGPARSLLSRPPFSPAFSKHPAAARYAAVFDVEEEGEEQPLTPRTPLLDGGSGVRSSYGGR